MPTTVLLVDDHELIRQGLRRAFESDAGFDVVGEASTVAEAVALATSLEPDVVVLDVRLPDGSGLDVARTLRGSHPTMGIVVLTMYSGDDQLFAALDAHASAFVAKDSPSDDVLAAARHAASTPTSFVAADLAGAMQRRLTPAAVQITARERDVLDLLAEGLSIGALSKRLFISESTAKTHISKLYDKLGAANRAQALMSAVQLGLVQPNRDGRPQGI